MTFGYMNVPETLARVRGNSTEPDDVRYNRILCKWFELNSNRIGSNELNSCHGVDDMDRLTDEERNVWIDEIRYLDLALSIAATDITINEIDNVIPIILRANGKYQNRFIPHNIRKVYNICKKHEYQIYKANGRCVRFQHCTHARRINAVLRKEYGYGNDEDSIDDDNSSYTVTDQNYNYHSNKYNVSKYIRASDRMLDDYMNNTNSVESVSSVSNKSDSMNSTVKQCLDNCFKPTEYIKPEVETVVFNEPSSLEPVSMKLTVENNINPLEPVVNQIESNEMELEEGEIDLNKEDITVTPIVNSVTPSNPTTASNNIGLVVKPIKVSSVDSIKVVSDSVKPVESNNSTTLTNSNGVSLVVKPMKFNEPDLQVNSTNPTTVSSLDSIKVSSEANLIINSLIQNIVPRALQNVNNTINDEIDKLNKTRNEVNAYLDDIIAKLKSLQSLM